MEKRKNENDWQYILDHLLTECINSNQLNNFHKLSNKDKIKFCISDNTINGTLSSFIEYIKDNKRFEKSSDVSKEYREKGNKLFASPKPLDAINAYNKSILYAPKNSEEIALSYGNRSAVLFLKNNYKACISDIDEALNFESSDKMREIKLLVRKGKAMLELNEEGSLKQFIRATELITNLKKELPSEKEKLDKFDKEIDVIFRAAMTERDTNSKKKNTKNDSYSAGAYLTDIKKNFVQNSELKDSSDKVKLENSKEKGRYIVANNDLSPGDVLFIEKPFAFVTLPDPNHSTCQNCCETNIDNPIACDFCAEGSYCSEECKNDAQKEFHYLECGFGLDIMYNIGIAHLAFRVAVLGSKPKNSLNYKRVNDLVNNIDKMKADDVFMYSLTASLLAIFLNDHTDFFKVETNLSSKVEKELEDVYNFGAVVLEHIGHLVCNGHAIIDYKTSSSKESNGIIIYEEQQRIGTGIFPSVSMLNHSCDPTIHASFIKNTLIVKSIKDMKKGSEIFNCYGPNFRRMTTKERQEALLSQYHFRCDCWACISPNEFTEKFKEFHCHYCSSKIDLRTSICTLCQTKHGGLTKALADVEKAMKKVKSLLNHYKFESACAVLIRIGEVLSQYGNMLNFTLVEMTDKLSSVLAQDGHFPESFHAFESGMFFHVSERYGKNSIELGNEICKISDLGVEIVNKEACVVKHRSTLNRCKVYCEVGMNIFDIHYGPYHDKYKALKQKAAFLKRYCD